MTLYEIREAIRTETNEARLTELIIERDRLVAQQQPVAPLSSDEHYARMLDYTHG